MKKLLLLSALALGAFAANAASPGDYYKVMVDGKELSNGDTVYITHYSDQTDVQGYNMGYSYETVIVYPNTSGTTLNLYATMGCTDRPTLEDFQKNQWVYVDGTYYTVNGNPNACFATALGVAGSCVINAPGGENVNDIAAGNDSFNWQFHCPTIAPTSVVKYTFTTAACTEKDASTKIAGTEFVVNLVFGPSMEAINNAGLSVEGVEMDEDVAPVYFNLNGTQVQNPSKGIYVVKRGSKVTKEVIR
jgi:hypothetical protein